MTKLDYSKVGEPDPGRVVDVRDSGVWSGNDDQPFEPASQRRERQARERAELAARSEAIRYKAMIKKYGVEKAVTLGVPAAFVASQLEAKLRAQHRKLRAKEKRERRAAHKAGL